MKQKKLLNNFFKKIKKKVFTQFLLTKKGYQKLKQNYLVMYLKNSKIL